MHIAGHTCKALTEPRGSLEAWIYRSSACSLKLIHTRTLMTKGFVTCAHSWCSCSWSLFLPCHARTDCPRICPVRSRIWYLTSSAPGTRSAHDISEMHTHPLWYSNRSFFVSLRCAPIGDKDRAQQSNRRAPAFLALRNSAKHQPTSCISPIHTHPIKDRLNSMRGRSTTRSSLAKLTNKMAPLEVWLWRNSSSCAC